MLYKDQLLTSPHHCMATQSEALLLDGSCSNALWDSFLQMIHVNHSDLTVYGRKEQYCCVLICWNQSLLMTKLRSYSSVQENWSHFVVIKIQNKVVMNRNQRGKYCTRHRRIYISEIIIFHFPCAQNGFGIDVKKPLMLNSRLITNWTTCCAQTQPITD